MLETGLSFRDAFGMAVGAFYGVDVVRALSVLEGGFHRLDVEAAVGELRVARGARSARHLAVFLVAGEAA